jgi:ATP-dependent DNA ligase
MRMSRAALGSQAAQQRVAALPGRSFLIDGEAIVTNGPGLAVFELIRRARHGDKAVLNARLRNKYSRPPSERVAPKWVRARKD